HTQAPTYLGHLGIQAPLEKPTPPGGSLGGSRAGRASKRGTRDKALYALRAADIGARSRASMSDFSVCLRQAPRIAGPFTSDFGCHGREDDDVCAMYCSIGGGRCLRSAPSSTRCVANRDPISDLTAAKPIGCLLHRVHDVTRARVSTGSHARRTRLPSRVRNAGKW